MTVQEVITLVDGIKPNAFTNDAKTAWINECEGLVQTEVMLLDIDEILTYTFAENAGTVLLAKPPHDKIYTAYLTAMIDFANGEYDKYQNTLQLFNAFYGEYMRWYAAVYRPADGDCTAHGYYLSAYGIAKAHGFEGTEEEWLSSLRGDSAYALAVEAGYEGTKAEWLSSLDGKSAYDLAAEAGYSGTKAQWLASLIGKSAYELAVDGGYTGTKEEWLSSLKGDKGDTGDSGVYIGETEPADADIWVDTRNNGTMEEVMQALSHLRYEDETVTVDLSDYATKTGTVLLYNEALALLSANPITAAAFRTYPYILGMRGTSSGNLYIYHVDRWNNSGGSAPFTCTIAKSVYNGTTTELVYTQQTPAFAQSSGTNRIDIQYVGGEIFRIIGVSPDSGGGFYIMPDEYDGTLMKINAPSGETFTGFLLTSGGIAGIITYDSQNNCKMYKNISTSEETTDTHVDLTGTSFEFYEVTSWTNTIALSLSSVSGIYENTYVHNTKAISKISGNTVAWTVTPFSTAGSAWDIAEDDDYLYIARAQDSYLTKIAKSDGSIVWQKTWWRNSGTTYAAFWLEAEEGLIYIYAAPFSAALSKYMICLEKDSADIVGEGDITIGKSAQKVKAGDYVYFSLYASGSDAPPMATGEAAPIVQTKRAKKYQYMQEVTQ